MPTILSLRRGDDLVLRATFTEDEMPPDPPMTGWTIEASMRLPECPPVPLTAGWIDEAGGVGYVRHDQVDTAALAVGEYELRIRAINSAGDATSAPAVHIQVTD